ncbi:MAG TPA: hypothetical protein VIK78_00125 [Ruminiclostridium sp.]
MENEKLFDLMEKMYSEMQGGFKSADVRLDKMDSRFDRLEAGQLSFENKLEDTRKTLFDGYIQTTEKLTSLDKKIDHLQIDVNNLSMKTINNDTRIIEISQELKRAR